MIVPRDGRWPRSFERPGSKVGVPPAESDPAADLEHTHEMEGTTIIGSADIDDAANYLGGSLPRIEQAPPGILVEETEMGRATGQWVVQIRCECGRRWFDVEMVKTARCPRCTSMVVVDPVD